MPLDLSGQTVGGGRNRGQFTANTAYRAGDIVFNSGVAYYANTDFTSGGTFNATNWTAFPVGSSVAPANLVWFAFTLPGDLSLITGAMPFPIPRAITIQNMKAIVGTRPTGGPVTLDVIRNTTTTSTSVFSDPALRPTIPGGAKASNVAVPDLPGINASDNLTVNVVSVGTTVPGSDLVLTIRAIEN